MPQSASSRMLRVAQKEAPCKRALRTLGHWDSQVSKTTGTRRWQDCQPYAPAASNLLEIYLVLFSIRGWVNSSTISQSEGFSQWEIPMTPLGIEPMTFELAARHLNILCHHVHSLNKCMGFTKCQECSEQRKDQWLPKDCFSKVCWPLPLKIPLCTYYCWEIFQTDLTERRVLQIGDLSLPNFAFLFNSYCLTMNAHLGLLISRSLFCTSSHKQDGHPDTVNYKRNDVWQLHCNAHQKIFSI